VVAHTLAMAEGLALAHFALRLAEEKIVLGNFHLDMAVGQEYRLP